MIRWSGLQVAVASFCIFLLVQAGNLALESSEYGTRKTVKATHKTVKATHKTVK